MNDCKLCSKIYTEEEAEKWKKNMDWEREDYNKPIVMRYDSGKIYLWARCNDSYYTGAVMKINYCPICGRKLTTD